MADNVIQYVISLKDMVTSGLKKAEGAANSLESALGSLKGYAMAAFAGWGIKEAIQQIVEAGASVEMTRIGLTNMLGSANEAGQVIRNTMKDAADTPFDFNNLLQANKMLIGAQVESTQARQDVLNLANAIASTGGGNDELSRMVVNLTQIKNVGKAAAVDIKQFAFANINIYRLLANQMGITTEQLKKRLENGLEITYERISEALKQAHEAGGLYAGGLEALSDSTTVKISAIGDALFQLKVKVFDDLKPAIDASIERIFAFIKALSGIWDEIAHGDSMNKIAAFLQPIQVAMAHVWQNIQEPIAHLFDKIMEWKEPFIEFITWIRDITGTVYETVAKVLPVLINLISAILGFLKPIYTFLERLQLFTALGNLFRNVLAIIRLIADAVQYIYETILKPAIRGFEWVLEKLGDILGLTKEIKGEIEGIATPKVGGIYDAIPGRKYDDFNNILGNVPGGGKSKNKAAVGNTGEETGTKKIAGQKILNIYITIDKLVDALTLQVTNLTEGSAKIKEMVQQALLSAVNDSQIVPER